MTPDNRIAVCPGSYDPITKGHVDIITRASEIFDELIVAVVNASVRKSKALFSTEERMAFLEEGTAHLDNVRVEPFDDGRSLIIVAAALDVGSGLVRMLFEDGLERLILATPTQMKNVIEAGVGSRTRVAQLQ